MPYPTEHAARIRQPSDFEQGSFRRVNNKFGPGAHVIFGRPKRGKDAGMEVQAIRFAKSKWTAERAEKWLVDNGYKPLSFEPASAGDAATKQAAPVEVEEVFSFRDVPAHAMLFPVSEFAVTDANGNDAKSAPLRMKARGGAPIQHPYWGKVAHDMKGMRLKAGRVAVDYNHDPKEIIGYLNHFDISSGDLMATGALVPYKENDRATEVAYKSRQGVPYEASIFFGGDCVIEEVGEDDETEVNGQTFAGPGVIFREWPLRGVALCPYGADANTESAMSASDKTFSVKVSGAITVETLDAEETQMNAEKEKADAEAARLAAVEAEAVAKAEAEKLAAVEAEKQAAALAAEKPGLKFQAAFGTQGCVWFAEGKTFEEAQALFHAGLATEVETLRKENAELKARLAAVAAAGVKPVAAGAEAPQADGAEKTFAELLAAKVADAAAKGRKATKTELMREVSMENPGAYAKGRGGKR